MSSPHPLGIIEKQDKKNGMIGEKKKDYLSLLEVRV